MIRSPLRLLAALALVALMLVRRRLWRQQQQRRAAAARARRATAPRRQARRAASSTQLGASDVDFLDPGQTYYTGGFQVLYATQTTLYAAQARPGRGGAGSRRRPAADLRRRQDGHGQAQEGRQVRPAGEPRGPGEGRQVRLRARRDEERPEPVHDVLQLHRGLPEEAGRAAGHPRHHGRQPVPDHVQAHAGPGPGLRRVPDHADHDAGPEGVRGEVRQAEPVDVQRARRLLRPVHGRERRPGQSDAATRPASRSTWSATRTGTSRWTSAPRTWTRSS